MRILEEPLSIVIGYIEIMIVFVALSYIFISQLLSVKCRELCFSVAEIVES